MSYIVFANGVGRIFPMEILEEEIDLRGIKRQALKFKFEAEYFSLRELASMFSKEKCSIITAVDENGNKTIYEGYVIKAGLESNLESLIDNKGGTRTFEVITITLTKPTEVEKQIETLESQLSNVQLSILDFYETNIDKN